MKWPLLRILGRRKPMRRSLSRARLAVEELESRLLPSTNVLTYLYGDSNGGVNSNETQLTPANVSSGCFGKLFTTPLDGQVYAQPLVDTAVTIANGPFTNPEAAGVHNVVFVATENDTLYAIDADPSSNGAILWKRSFLNVNDPNDALSGATSVTPVPYQDATDSNDIVPTFGITSTPVIDPNTNTIYVIAATKEMVNGTAHYVQRLHAINIADGTDVTTPFLIGDTTNNNDNNTQLYVYGTGMGSVTDPYNGTGQQVVQFNALHENQRAALRLVNGSLYVAWSTHGDDASDSPDFGWVASWNTANLASNGFQLSGVFNTDPNLLFGGVWQAGAGVTFTPDGSAFYFTTGNSPENQVTLDSNGFPVSGNYTEAVLKVVPDSSTTPQNQNENGWGFKVADYFMPAEAATLGQDNLDLATDATLLPSSAGIPGHPNLLIAGGKSGQLFLIDANNMGHFDPTNQDVLNAVTNSQGNLDAPQYFNGVLSTPIYFNGELYVMGGYNDPASAFVINSDGSLSQVSQTNDTFGYEPGSPVISSNGTSNAILWLMNRNNNELTAYDPSNLGDQLWNSGQGGANSLDSTSKFAVPIEANGMVFVGTKDGLTVYGLNEPTNVSQAPTLSAAALSGSSVNLTWQDSSQRPNTASAYLIEESTDGSHFTQVTTAAQGATALALGGLSADTTYYFRIRGINSAGNSAYSNVVSVTTTNGGASLDFSGGFANSANQLTYNGSASISGNNAQLTDGGTFEASSVFTDNRVNIDTFQTQFTFQLSAGTTTADGFTFTIQGVGPTALGLYGGGLGYGPDSTGNNGGIGQSVAIKFDLYNNQGEGSDSTGLYTDGAAPTNLGSIDLSNTGIDLHSGDVFQVNMTYGAGTLTVTIQDTTTGAAATQQYSIDIPGTVGGDTAYVGFTAGTGGETAVQSIRNWTFTNGSGQAPNAPSGLTAAPVSGNSLSLSWTPTSSNQQGYFLDRATDAGFTQNVITELLSATASSFTDTFPGLTPGGGYYYRLRAFNSAGSSVNSAVASVEIPPIPPTPSNPLVTLATTSEVDLRWTDNAGSLAGGYAIYRSTDGGPFLLQIALPPGTTSWHDTNVAANTSYSYQIVAYNTSGSNGYAAVSVTTPPAATSPPSQTLLSPSSVNNLFQLVFQMEFDAFLLTAYSSSTLPQSSSGSSLTSQVFALLADIEANPLFNTPLGSYALGLGAALAQPPHNNK